MIIDTDKFTKSIKDNINNIIDNNFEGTREELKSETKDAGKLIKKFKWLLAGIILTVIFPKVTGWIIAGGLIWYATSEYFASTKKSTKTQSSN